MHLFATCLSCSCCIHQSSLTTDADLVVRFYAAFISIITFLSAQIQRHLQKRFGIDIDYFAQLIHEKHNQYI